MADQGRFELQTLIAPLRFSKPRQLPNCFFDPLEYFVDAPRGFEPRFPESKSGVLPLDDGATFLGYTGFLTERS